jgi:preprotein translocase subunit SecB
VAEGIFEVCVTATVQTKVKDKTLFLVEAKQAGIFEIRNVPQEQMQGIMGIVCPQMSTRTCAPSSPTCARAPASRPSC